MLGSPVVSSFKSVLSGNRTSSKGLLSSKNKIVKNSLTKQDGSRRFYPGKGALQALGLRRKTINTIEKITGTMKLVAQAQLNKVAQKAKETEPFFYSANSALERLGKVEGEEKNVLTVLVTSNRGLCGSLNSQMVRDAIKLPEVLRKGNIYIYGDKGVMAIEKRPEGALVVGSSHPTKSVTFHDLGYISEQILKNEFDELLILYNKFVSNSVFEMRELRIPSLKTVLGKVNDLPYEYDESAETLFKDFQEFLVASALHFTTTQNTASETLSRRNAMDGANKNCKELKLKLSIIFNKLRQALITTELIEITSGATVVEEMENA